MNKLLLLIFLIGVVSFFPPTAEGKDDDHPVFVSASWLADHLHDPSLIILHVAPIRRDYQKEHIPGARFLWSGSLVKSNPELNNELLPVEQLDTSIEGLGISNESRIILYGKWNNFASVARAFATLDYLGMGDNTSILDGGFDAWRTEGRTTTIEIPEFNRGSFSPNIKQAVFVDAEYVKSNLHKADVSIIDVRSPQLFNGATITGNPRTGHIPGAVNIYSGNMLDSTSRLLPPFRLHEKFDSAGVKEGNDVVTYCNTGMAASITYAVARSLGFNAHVYDGSIEEWGWRDDLPLEVPAKQDSVKKQ